MGHDNKIPLEDIKPITWILKHKVVARIVWNKIESAKISTFIVSMRRFHISLFKLLCFLVNPSIPVKTSWKIFNNGCYWGSALPFFCKCCIFFVHHKVFSTAHRLGVHPQKGLRRTRACWRAWNIFESCKKDHYRICQTTFRIDASWLKTLIFLECLHVRLCRFW